ncbi:MAG: GNAT family N-acetyltransferase [Candidatus Sericytochromatia bacterium]|nr:GNAT family N-acetyltransferase [Candidatus Sericytochromatia bacterium]
MAPRPAGLFDAPEVLRVLEAGAVRMGRPLGERWREAGVRRFGDAPGCLWLEGDAAALIDRHGPLLVVRALEVPTCLDWLPRLLSRTDVEAVLLPEEAALALPGTPAFDRLPLPEGLRLYQRFEHDYELTGDAAEQAQLPEGYVIRPLEPEHFEQVGAMLSAVNLGSLNGVYLTFPDWPTPDRCRRLLHALHEARDGALLGAVAWFEDRPVAAILGMSEDDQVVLLYEIAVRLRHRSLGLSGMLFESFKRRAVSLGRERLRFLTVAGVRGVENLFDLSVMRSRRVDRIWFGRRSIFAA